MKWESKIQECKDMISEEYPDHLHIRRRAIVTDFIQDLQSELQDYDVISIDVSEWEKDEILETLSHELQKEKSLIRYAISRITGIGGSILGVGANVSVDEKPYYSQVSDNLRSVARTNSQVVIFINYHGDRPVEGFGWLPKLDIPDNLTVITDGYTNCDLDVTTEFEIGRLSKSETVEYLTSIDAGIDEATASEIHHIHDGNPTAIEIANKYDSLEQKLTGEALEDLWSKVYDNKLTGDEFDLLTDSSHLIDLDSKDVALVTDMKHGKAEEILKNLGNKGVVSQKQSGLFTTDVYVKEYMSKQLLDKDISQQHRSSFQNYVEKWMDTYNARMQKIKHKTNNNDNESIEPPDIESGFTEPSFFLAIYHLSNIHNELDKEQFIKELENLDGEVSNVFAFGMMSQRFFFEDPTEIIQDLAESILDLDKDVETELFSGTLGVLFNFDVQEYLSELSSGWNGSINTESLETKPSSNPDETVKTIQQTVKPMMPDESPIEINVAVSHFVGLIFADTRKAREYYRKFGRTADKYGLEEDAFCNWLDELQNLIDDLSPNIDSDDDTQTDKYEEGFESLNSEIRTRIDLREYLEENHSQAQQEFQQRIEIIRNQPEEIANQYIRCGKQLEETENPIFPFIWYAVGHELFSKVVLGGENRDIFAEYNRLLGTRERQEEGMDADEIVITADGCLSMLKNTKPHES